MGRELVIGVDGGGTRSQGVLVGVDGECLRRTDGGALNYNTMPHAEFVRNLEALIDELLVGATLGTCVRTVVGTAALFHQATVEEKAKVLSGVDLDRLGDVSLVGDAVTAVSGAARGMGATLVVAGTGSIVVSQDNDGAVAFAGGLGPLIGGDPGSAFWMACKAIQEVQRRQVQTGEVGNLGRTLFGFFEVRDLFELVAQVYRDPSGRQKVAALAQTLAASSDPEVVEPWRRIEVRAGQELADQVSGLVSRSTPAGEVVFVSGSVLRKNQRVRDALADSLSRNHGLTVRLEEPAFDAAMGAAFIALREVRRAGA